MSDSIKARLEAAVRSEPPVGDPYARFERRRRVSRGLRTFTGFLIAGLTMVGFVRIFPGGSGGSPDDGFIPNPNVAPAFEPYRRFAAGELGLRMLVPEAWPGEVREGYARVGPSLAADLGVPGEVEIRFGTVAAGVCESDDCRTLASLVDDPRAARDLGFVVEPVRVPAGTLPVDGYSIRFPAGRPAEVAPSCLGCVGYYAEVGSSRLPMLVLARNAGSLAASKRLIDQVLETIVVT